MMMIRIILAAVSGLGIGFFCISAGTKYCHPASRSLRMSPFNTTWLIATALAAIAGMICRPELFAWLMVILAASSLIAYTDIRVLHVHPVVYGLIIAAVLMRAALAPTFLYALYYIIGGITAFIVLLVISLRMPHGIGSADKYAAAGFGILLGPYGISLAIALASVSGLILFALRKGKHNSKMPFAMLLAASAFILLCFRLDFPRFFDILAP
ncbi:MAG: prepilin peptidase [Spirochaetes bacterium]|nr:prepilin peptidase [Spirochaetota bacterium]